MAINLVFAAGGTDSALSFGSTYYFYYDSMNITYRYQNEIDQWVVVRSILDLVETCMGAVFERDGKTHRGVICITFWDGNRRRDKQLRVTVHL